MNHTNDEVTDVLVVGAGLCGLAAAWDLQRDGLSVCVVEARTRLGGRAHTESHDHDGTRSAFDLGAHFIGHESYQTNIWSLCSELGIEVFEQYDGPGIEPGVERNPYWAGQGANLQALGGDITAHVGTTLPPSRAGQFYMMYLEQLSRSIPLTNVARTTNARRYDDMSVWDWVTTIDIPGWGPAPEEFRALVRMLCRVGFSTEPEQINMLWMLFYIASSGGLQRFQALRWPVQGAQGYRLVHGAESIADALGERLTAAQPGCLHLGAPVIRVWDRGDQVEVTTKDGVVRRARKVLIAMAPRLCGRIEFDPPLPAARVAAAEHMAHAFMIMTYVTFDEAFWRTDTTTYQFGTVNGIPTDGISRFGLTGDALFTDGPVVWIMDNTSGQGQPALFAFLVGDEGRRLGAATRGDREAAVLAAMARAFGDQVTQHSPRYHEKDWNLDPYSDGCPAAHFEPGTFLDAADGVLLSGLGDVPHHNVYFASTEASTVSNGYLDGAVWAGHAVALDITASMQDASMSSHRLQARHDEILWTVRTILTAIAEQNPLMEGPVIASDAAFHPPGGRVLGGGPYIGEQGTVEFYVRLLTMLMLSDVNVESVSVNAESNLAYARCAFSGIVTSTGRPFRNVPAVMMFHFSDPAETEIRLVEEWLAMDSALIDDLVAPGNRPVPHPAVSRGRTRRRSCSVDLRTFRELASSITGRDVGVGPTTVLYGPGGPGWSSAASIGVAAERRFNRCANLAGVAESSVHDVTYDPTTLTVHVTMRIVGTSALGTDFDQHLFMVGRIENDCETKLAEVRYFTDVSSFAPVTDVQPAG